MPGMKSSWDEETHQRLLEDLVEAEFDAERVEPCDQSVAGVSRAPDLQHEIDSGTQYIYFLQPEEVTSDFFQSLSGDSLAMMHFFVPVPEKETAENALEERSAQPRLSFYRLSCGLLQVFSG